MPSFFCGDASCQADNRGKCPTGPGQAWLHHASSACIRRYTSQGVDYIEPVALIGLLHKCVCCGLAMFATSLASPLTSGSTCASSGSTTPVIAQVPITLSLVPEVAVHPLRYLARHHWANRCTSTSRNCCHSTRMPPCQREHADTARMLCDALPGCPWRAPKDSLHRCYSLLRCHCSYQAPHTCHCACAALCVTTQALADN